MRNAKVKSQNGETRSGALRLAGCGLSRVCRTRKQEKSPLATGLPCCANGLTGFCRALASLDSPSRVSANALTDKRLDSESQATESRRVIAAGTEDSHCGPDRMLFEYKQCL